MFFDRPFLQGLQGRQKSSLDGKRLTLYHIWNLGLVHFQCINQKQKVDQMMKFVSERVGKILRK